MKILIGTVPYGRDNVGDEAIIATVVQSVRETMPEADITVSTDDQSGTSKKLDVRTVPLFCHNVPGATYEQMVEEVSSCDAYIWGGATGLSDYPENALEIADLALSKGKKLILYGCGMNSEFNPAHYQLHAGPKRAILSCLGAVTGDSGRFIRAYQMRKEDKTRRHLRSSLNQASLIIVRDEPTKALLVDCGVTREINAMADPAILLPKCDDARLEEIWSRSVRWSEDERIVGIGISAQREVSNLDDVVRLADYIIEKENAKVLFLPMNHKTDAATMLEIRMAMRHREKSVLMEGFFEPEEIAALAGRTDLVISSRLHLLILATISSVPLIGLSRGSKIDNFLMRLGERSAGTVENFDLEEVKTFCDRLLNDKSSYLTQAAPEIERMKAQARESRILLGEALAL